MKQYCTIFMFIFCLVFNSCINTSVMDAQNINYYSRYYYGVNSYPVIYIGSIPYYYNNRWIVVPHSHYSYIRHYQYPMTFRGQIPHSWRRYNYREQYPSYRKYDRPQRHNDQQHKYRINQRPSRGRK